MDQETSDQPSLLVLSYPSFADNDLTLIQEIRHRLDQEVADCLRPHFTHVLPHDISWERTIEIAAQATAKQFEPIEFSIKTLTILDDPDTGENFLVLIPKNYESMIDLHLALYDSLGLPAPYGENWKPHITIGVSTNRQLLIDEAKQLKATVAGLEGTIDSIEVVKWQPGEIETIASLPLGKN